MSLKTRFAEFTATKTTLFWTSVGVSVLTIVVGFSAFDWKTGKAANEMVQAAVDEVRGEFATTSCVQAFLASADPAAEQAALKEVKSFKRDSHIAERGWLSKDLAGSKKVERSAGKACIAEILKAEF